MHDVGVGVVGVVVCDAEGDGVGDVDEDDKRTAFTFVVCPEYRYIRFVQLEYPVFETLIFTEFGGTVTWTLHGVD